MDFGTWTDAHTILLILGVVGFIILSARTTQLSARTTQNDKRLNGLESHEKWLNQRISEIEQELSDLTTEISDLRSEMGKLKQNHHDNRKWCARSGRALPPGIGGKRWQF